MPSELKIVKKKDCDGNIYYTAYLGNQIGGGETRNEAREERFILLEIIKSVERKYKI